MKNAIAFLALTLSLLTQLFAQDARLTQYDKIPFIMSPSLIGNFDGSSRVIGYYNYATDDNLSNNVFNLSADFKTKNNRISLGFNYMKTGSENFAVSGDYFGFGFSKSISIDKNRYHKFKIGSQVSFFNPVYNKNKKGYNAYLDPRTFPFTKTSRIPDSLKYTNQYWGLNMGGSYTYTFNRICFEANASMYNLLWFTQKKDIARKRRRLMTNLSFKYGLNKYSNLKFEQLTWQEGHFFDSDQEIILADSIGIKDVIYAFMYENTDKRPYNFGLKSRSIKSFSLIFGIQIFKNISTQLSYELPLRKDLDNPTQFGISFTYIDKKKKNSVELPVVASFGDSILLNENDFTKVVNVHDTIFVYKNDTVLIYTNNDAENNIKNNLTDENKQLEKSEIKKVDALIDASFTASNSDASKINVVENNVEVKVNNDSIKQTIPNDFIVSKNNDSAFKENDTAVFVQQVYNKIKSDFDKQKNIIPEKNIASNNSNSNQIDQDVAIIVQQEQPVNDSMPIVENSNIVKQNNNRIHNKGVDNKSIASDIIAKNKFQTDSSKQSVVRVANKLTIEKRELMNVYFDFNKSFLSDTGKLIINQFISNQKIKPGVKLLIEGFCDDIGSESHNLKLSKSRANAVKKYLIEKGIDKKIISLIHFGKTYKSLSDADRWKYRKSVIVLID